MPPKPAGRWQLFFGFLIVGVLVLWATFGNLIGNVANVKSQSLAYFTTVSDYVFDVTPRPASKVSDGPLA